MADALRALEHLRVRSRVLFSFFLAAHDHSARRVRSRNKRGYPRRVEFRRVTIAETKHDGA